MTVRVWTNWLVRVTSPSVNAVLKPFGLILWVTYWTDEDANGLPINLRVTGLSIGRRPPDMYKAIRKALRS